MDSVFIMSVFSELLCFPAQPITTDSGPEPMVTESPSSQSTDNVRLIATPIGQPIIVSVTELHVSYQPME